MTISKLSRRNFLNKSVVVGSALIAGALGTKAELFASEGDNEIKFCWLGVAGFLIKYKNKVILIDPYFSREKFGDIHPVSWDYMKKYIPRADDIIMSHSHGDHLVDTPAIAKGTGAKVIGSETTINICRSFKVPQDQLVMTAGNEKKQK